MSELAPSALTARALISVAMLVAAEVLMRYLRRHAAGPRATERAAWAAWWLTRPALSLVLFLILEFAPRTDVLQHYVPQAQAALRGELVYRDFRSSYGPLFGYLGATLIALGTGPLGFIAAAIGFEAVALKLWLRAEPAPTAARAEAAVVYACTPFVAWDVAVSGHNQAWLSAGLALVLWLATTRSAWLLAGLALALAAAAGKLLALVLAPALCAHAGRRGRFVLGLGVGLVATHAPFAALGADVLQPLRGQSALWTSGNLPFLVSSIWPSVLEQALIAPLVLGLALVAAALASRARSGAEASSLPALEAALCLAFVVFLLVSRKAYTHYAVLMWLPACALLARRGLDGRTRAGLYALAFLVHIEPALWFHLVLRVPLHELERHGVTPGIRGLFITAELALLAGYGWLLRAAWQGLVQSRPS